MMNKLLISLIFISLIGKNVESQNANQDVLENKKQSDWGFFVAPYVMFASQATDVGGNKIRQSFNDLTSLTNSGFQIVGGIRYKKWNAVVDGTFANLGFNEVQSVLNLELKIIQNILDLRLGYLVYENYKYDDNQIIKGWSLEVNGGAKYWRNDIGLKFSLGDNDLLENSIDEQQRWWDLMIGLRFKFVLSRKVLLGISGSGGGFGIGKSNDFAYDFTYSNSFIVSDLIMINAGFRNFKYNRTDGVGEDELKTSVNVLGPILGVLFKF